MREGVDAVTLALYLSQRFDTHERFRVANGSGALIDLQLRWVNYNLQKPQPNLPIGALTVDFARDASPSLSPAVTSSVLNRLNDGATFSPLLQIGRTVVMEVALTAEKADTTSSSVWYEVFRGTIANVKWPQFGSHIVSVAVLDLGGVLQKTKSETAYTYLAGTPIETVAQQILTNNGRGSIAFSCPVPTGKVLPNDVAPGLQKNVWEQLANLARQTGLVIWFRYSGTNTLELVMFAPERDKVVVDQSFEIVFDYTEMGVDEQEIGSTGYIVFFDENGVQQTIGPLVDEASIARYGGEYAMRRPFWIVLDPTSPVRTSVDATAMLTAALSDVADPDVVGAVTLPPLWFGESAVDLYEFPVIDGRLFDVPQQGAPFAITIQRQGDQQPYTTVNIRGKPSAGRRAWQIVGGGTIIASANANALINFREYTDADGVTTLAWDSVGSLVQEVWAGSVVFNAPLPADPWALVAGTVLPLPAGTLSLSYPQPGEGQRRLIQVETRLAVMELGPTYRVNQFGTPAPVRFDAVPTETADDVTLGVRITDPRGVVSEVRFYTLVLGVRTGPIAATASDGNYYAFTLALDPKHPVGIQPEVMRNDGFPPILGEMYTADTDKRADIKDVRSGVGNEVLVDADTDTVSLHYKEVVSGTPGAETSIPPRVSDPRFGVFSPAPGATERLFRIYGKNAAGDAGDYVEWKVKVNTAVVPPALTSATLGVVNRAAGLGREEEFSVTYEVSGTVTDSAYRLYATVYEVTNSGLTYTPKVALSLMVPSAGTTSQVLPTGTSTAKTYSATVVLHESVSGSLGKAVATVSTPPKVETVI